MTDSTLWSPESVSSRHPLGDEVDPGDMGPGRGLEVWAVVASSERPEPSRAHRTPQDPCVCSQFFIRGPGNGQWDGPTGAPFPRPPHEGTGGARAGVLEPPLAAEPCLSLAGAGAEERWGGEAAERPREALYP